MKLENYGCEYVNSQIFWQEFLPGREINGETVEAEFVESARKVPGVYKDDNGKFLTNENAIAIPVEKRTSIQVIKDKNGNIIRDEEGNIIESRKFNGAICGASFAIPQLVGYFALARQMNPTMSFKTFVNKAREQAKVNSKGQLFINPIEVTEKIWEEHMVTKHKESEIQSNVQPKSQTQTTKQKIVKEAIDGTPDLSILDNIEQEKARQQR